MSTAAIAYLGVLGLGLLTLFFSSLIGRRRDVANDDELATDPAGDGDTPAFLSIKLVSCFLAGFGAAALLSDAFLSSEIREVDKLGLDLGCGVGGGLLAGGLGWLVISLFRSVWTRREARARDFVGMDATLTNGVPEGGFGAITFEFRGQHLTMDVRSTDGRAIAKGARVRIVISRSEGTGVVERVVTASWKDMGTGEY